MKQELEKVVIQFITVLIGLYIIAEWDRIYADEVERDVKQRT
jgi:hypothetical protein